MPTYGQEDAGLKFTIQVTHKGNPYPEGLVKIFKNNSFLDQVKVNEGGEFTYLLSYTGVFQLKFTGEGMATKTIELDLLTDVPEVEKNTVHDWSIGEIEIFKNYKEIDADKLEKPIARIHYDKDLGDFSIDYKYTGKRKKELATVEAQVEKLEKKEAIVQKENKKEYEDLVVRGNQALNGRRYNEAKKYFKSAIVLNPEGEAKQKLAAINAVLKREEDYKNLLAEGDALVENNEYQSATEKFLAAGAIKPTAAYPKQQIALISQKIKVQEQQANAFNNYMAVANSAYEEGNFEVASENFNKALDINPDALLASKKLELSETKLKEKEQAQQKEEIINNAIVEIQSAIKSGDLVKAKESLSLAESKYPNEPKLKVQRNKVAQLIEKEKARQLEEEKNKQIALKEKEKRFTNYIELAKKAQADGDKKSAIFFYEKAQDINPGNAQVKAGLIAANKMKTQESVETSNANNNDLDKMDKKSSDFHSKLAELYPEGKTVKTEKKGNKEVTRVIIVSGSKGTEYQKIKYNWGGVYFFKNGDPITPLIFEKETN